MKTAIMIRIIDNDCMGNPSTAILEYQGNQYTAVNNIYNNPSWYIIDLGLRVDIIPYNIDEQAEISATMNSYENGWGNF